MSKSAYPMIARCASRQLAEDGPMIRALVSGEMTRDLPFITPNLLVTSGERCRAECPDVCDQHTGQLLPVLMFK